MIKLFSDTGLVGICVAQHLFVAWPSIRRSKFLALFLFITDIDIKYKYQV